MWAFNFVFVVISVAEAPRLFLGIGVSNQDDIENEHETTGGYVAMHCGNNVDWRSKMLSWVASSSGQVARLSEPYAIKDAFRLGRLLDEFFKKQDTRYNKVYCDNITLTQIFEKNMSASEHT